MNTFFLGVPEWREIADFGTFSDLNHLLEGEVRIGLGWVGYLPGGCGRVVLGPGVKIRGKITLGHPQKLAKRREKVDSGTFPDLNHFLRRVKSSELFLRHPSTSVDVLEGLEGDVGRYFAIKRSWYVPFRALKGARWPILHVFRPRLL